MLSVVKMMKEQGNQFDWSQIAIDLTDLPCFKPEAEWPENAGYQDILAESYQALYDEDLGRTIVVKVTGDDPAIEKEYTSGTLYITGFVDCEPVFFRPADEVSDLTPIAFYVADLSRKGVMLGSMEGFGRSSTDTANCYSLVSIPYRSASEWGIFLVEFHSIEG